MNELELELYRLRFRVQYMERFALRLHLLVPVMTGAKTLEESRASLLALLETEGQNAEKVYLEGIKDPAVASLFADEVREIIESLKKFVQDYRTL